MRVYHGSTVAISEPLVRIGRKNLDFGQGFYITDLKEQAVSWASMPLNANKPKVLNVYELDLDAVIAHQFRYLHFAAYDAEWLDFVVSNRKGGQQWTDYDLIEGGIANDRVFNTIELYSTGLINMEMALQRLKYEQPNNQLCILNQEIVDHHLQFIESVIISELQ